MCHLSGLQGSQTCSSDTSRSIKRSIKPDHEINLYVQNEKHNTTERIMITFSLFFCSFYPSLCGTLCCGQHRLLPAGTFSCIVCVAARGRCRHASRHMALLLLCFPLSCTYNKEKKSVSGLYVHYAILALSYIEKDRTRV